LTGDVKEKVQAMANSVTVPLLPNREFYQWLAYEIDVDAEEFLLGVVGDWNVSELMAMKPQMPGAVEGMMCYAFSHITRTTRGTHVVQITHFNPQSPELPFHMFSARSIYGMVWPLLVNRVPRIINRAHWQAARNWSDHKLSVPREYWQEKHPKHSKVVAAVAQPLIVFPTPPPLERNTNDNDEGNEFELITSYVLWITVVAFCCSCVMCASGIYCCCRPQQAKKDCDDRCWRLVDTENGSTNGANSDDDTNTVVSTVSITSSAREVLCFQDPKRRGEVE